METTRGLLELVQGSVEAGGAGVAMGRNVFQAADPVKMVRAISAVVHRGAGVDEAMEILS
jgi:class I fructose-bisphosphate aldolase